MRDWKKILVSPSDSIREVIRIIDDSAMQIALVTDDSQKLLGTVTDGDVRRGILRGVTPEDPVKMIMNSQPTTVRVDEARNNILLTMKLKRLRHIPIVDENSHVAGLESLDEFLQPHYRENWVVLMAGGMGTRLRPLTNACPKPLLKVGNKPILEIILENFMEYGFRHFFLSVNYKAEMIEEYFGDGSRWDVTIEYLREEHKMGTAGSLSLLPGMPTQPVFVMNGDLLTKVNFQQLLDFHKEHRSKATMCVREFDFQVPYGVVKVKKHRLTGIDEKPVQKFFVNAGIYVLEPEALEFVPENDILDMPSLFEQLIEAKHETAVFPIREYWLDIGQMGDFEKANGEFVEVFK